MSLLLLTALLTMAGCTDRRARAERRHAREIYHDTESVDLDKAERADVEIDLGAGNLKVNGGSAKLLDAEFSYGDTSQKPMVHYSPGSLRGHLTIEQPRSVEWGVNERHEWNLRLNNQRPMDITARLGAGNAEMNLGSVSLRHLDIRMGVGNLDLDLRGHPEHDYDVDVKGGVGNATVYLPAAANIIADAKGGVGHIGARGLEKRNGQWVSPSNETAKTEHQPTIHLDIRGGVGNIDLLAN